MASWVCRWWSSEPVTVPPISSIRYGLLRYSPFGYLRPWSSRAAADEMQGRSAYEVLGVSERSTFTEIKSAFRRLAKENHPDVAPSKGASASRRFLAILAAYEILSDPERRSHYDSYLHSQREVLQVQRQGHNTTIHAYGSSTTLTHDIEVVEWLKCYKIVIDDILSGKRHRNLSGYWNRVQYELHAAIHSAYYGPLVECMELLPSCFEAEERSTAGTSEVLHLVSGRYLFGIVSINKVPSLYHSNCRKLDTFPQNKHAVCDKMKSNPVHTPSLEDRQEPIVRPDYCGGKISEAYVNLELHIFGQLVATATRFPPDANSSTSLADDLHDTIHIFLKANEVPEYPTKTFYRDYALPDAHGSMVPLGTIKGLETSPEEGSCFVYDETGAKTHMIVKHRTLLVKHMHWFSVGDNVSNCECRCRRARLPSSKYWLFKPRCDMHDIGGWYIETFGHAKDGRTTLSKRQWDGNKAYHEKRLHPAVYLLALAYRTLDIEVVNRKKRTVTDTLMPKLHNALRWCRTCLK